jgi:hypothetical protein
MSEQRAEQVEGQIQQVAQDPALDDVEAHVQPPRGDDTERLHS